MPPFSHFATKTNGFSWFFIFMFSPFWLHFTSILSPKWVTISFQNLTFSTLDAIGGQTGPQGRPSHPNGVKMRAQGPQKTPKSHPKHPKVSKRHHKSRHKGQVVTKVIQKGGQDAKINPKVVTEVVPNNEARWRNRRQPLDSI